jgi:hypothetical protein
MPRTMLCPDNWHFSRPRTPGLGSHRIIHGFFAIFGAVSFAYSTASIVTSASAIIRIETGHVAPLLRPTIAVAMTGTGYQSAPDRGSQLIAQGRTAVAKIGGKHFA